MENMKPDVVYVVTKGNTDGSVLNGDIVVLASRDGSLNLYGHYGGWLDKDELTPEIMDLRQKKLLIMSISKINGVSE